VDQSDERRIRNNVADGFRGLLDQIAASSLPPRPDVEGKIQVAFKVRQTGECNLAISPLLDATIKLREGRQVPALRGRHVAYR
jgi:hypothetical protein